MDESSLPPIRKSSWDRPALGWSIPAGGLPGRIQSAPGIEHHRPFAWQQAETLWILDWERDCWVLAELRFDADACAYRERRRTRYRWQREAAGALLGRILRAGDDAATEASSHLLGWLCPGRAQA